jgi:hypothetical protein
MTNSNEQITGRIVALMQADDSTDAPQDSVTWAKNIFRARAAEPKTSLVQKIMAVLQADLSPQRAAFGERSAATGQARQMLFDAGNNNLDLRIKENENGWEIHGQILGDGFAGGTIELSGDETYQAAINEMSEFKFTGVVKGNYNVTANNGEIELSIEGLTVK